MPFNVRLVRAPKQYAAILSDSERVLLLPASIEATEHGGVPAPGYGFLGSLKYAKSCVLVYGTLATYR